MTAFFFSINQSINQRKIVL